ncbi:hypothetical protein CAPTEDRAFT_173647 [Capitella teleta]|uniref:Phospholipid/glycerol acyltransferase domain-containing protein n=1 Tax=Capitella teleta TaxID=283909 RepID=X1ZD60_CAPTE|nr:hypothetical protein CAPTEDRAFT_173647 [Capitella teleta]|eukprot:ELU04707.1 hypothetical protein CAPTEDRAFT_173647 [Capitella teleta]
MDDCVDQCAASSNNWSDFTASCLSESWNWLLYLYHTYLEEAFLFVHAHYLDVYYFGWLAWVFWPLVITFVLPAVLIIFVYASALFLQVYRLRHHIRDAYAMEPWEGARQMICVFWDATGHLWHGFEIDGIEKLPENGPGLLVYYHGAIPIDVYYIISKLLLKKKRILRTVGDRFLFMIPGLRLLMQVFHVVPGTVKSCAELVKDGHLLAIAPGGVREAYFSDSYYNVLWGKRTGFAKIALEANVPIYPVFTRNCRETIRSLSIGRTWLRWIYEKTRMPLVPIYGGFPVKLKTYIGDPIYPDPNATADEFALQVKNAMESLIAEHQPIPGNILRALYERAYPATIPTSELKASGDHPTDLTNRHLS